MEATGFCFSQEKSGAEQLMVRLQRRAILAQVYTANYARVDCHFNAVRSTRRWPSMGIDYDP